MDEIDMDRLERELEGDGTESDSSLDLHTPFAHVMLRDGLISPRSKVIAALDTSTRPGSTISTASVKTKTGLFKDHRDTLKRRRRHRDGRLLRGGIGLTTGLGWSDSEDEDSPSPLTRRLSSMAISRTSSVASMRSLPGAGPSPLSRTQSTVSADGTWTRQSSTRSSTFSNSSSSSARLPTTREDDDTELPPPLPPKDNHATRSLPTRRSQPTTPTTPGPRTLKSKPSLKSIPTPSEFGVVERPPITQSLSGGPRPLKLGTSSSMLRSTSLGNSPLANGRSMSNPVVRSTGSLDSRNRTKSVPSSITVSPSPLLKNSKSLQRPVPVPTSSIPNVSSPLLDPSRQRSRIGTGMMYKKSGPLTSEFGIASGLKRPTLTTSGLPGVRSQRLGVPSPLRTGGSSGGSSPSSSVEFGIAL
ncbi:hypothetical protein BJ322DRAFT_574801 [Thelephora terrestris]|nr:hypothetical protein BJ322DRAFT_574801 [Thelephora terrestris]